MRSIKTAEVMLAIGFTAILWGCPGRESLKIEVDPENIVGVGPWTADGQTVIPVSAVVKFRGDPIPDGKPVVFSASQPVLLDPEDNVTSMLEQGLRPKAETKITITSQGGQARVSILSPVDTADVLLSATHTTVNKDVLTDEYSMKFSILPLVAAGMGTQSNLTKRFDFACEQTNVGAFITGRGEIRVPCHLLLQDVSGKYLFHVPVKFYTEAGTMVDVPATDKTPRTFYYTVPAALLNKPYDVRPSQDEINRNLQIGSNDPAIQEHNPRDGLVTILAVVRGQEAFDDTNGNHSYDVGKETFIDEGEPFLDVDDDGFYTPVDPSPCCDTNLDNQVTGLNGVWDSDIWLGRTTHILWTGLLDSDRSSIKPTPVGLAAGSIQTLTLFALDKNFNPLAANGDADKLKANSNLSKLKIDPTELTAGLTLISTTGMVLNNQFPFFRFGTGLSIFIKLEVNENDQLVGREWAVTVSDGRTTHTDQCKRYTWNVNYDFTYTPAVSYTGTDFDALNGQIIGSGSLEALTDGSCI